MKKKGKQKFMTGISASLTPDFRDKEKSNNDNVEWMPVMSV